MDAILDLGIRIILFLQGLGAWLAGPMKFFSFLGNEEFFLFAAPAVYWCLDAALGVRLGLLLMINGSVNAAFKLSLHAPRPYWYSPEVQPMIHEHSFGIPSGHSQNAVGVWGGLAAWVKRSWMWIVGVLLILFIGLSRMYTAAHFPTDVLAGWLLGVVTLVLFLALEGPVMSRFRRRLPSEQILYAFGASLVLILVPALVRLNLGAFVVPADWVERAALAFPDGEAIKPLAISGPISYAGTFFGLACGAILIATQGGFDARGVWWRRLARFLLGAIGVGLLWYGLGEMFPRGEYGLSYLLRYVRYTLIGLWVSAGAPILFIRMGLAGPLSQVKAGVMRGSQTHSFR